jgi:hypothetical protein
MTAPRIVDPAGVLGQALADDVDPAALAGRGDDVWLARRGQPLAREPHGCESTQGADD